MITAKVYPNPGHESRPDAKIATEGVHPGRLYEARKVLRYSAANADSVAALTAA